MIKEEAHDERQITDWPPSFSSEATPYDESDFGSLIRRICESKSLTLRISKAIVIGDVAVGKTSLVNRFCHRSFNNNYKATIGVDFEVERFDILGVPFHLQIWDTAGQERFKSIAASYYRGANVIVVVFDLGNLMSLMHCQQWLNEADRSNVGPYHIFLVGTKKDLLSHPVYEIIEKRAIEAARRMRAEYWAVSSRTGNGVAELFTRLAALSFHAMVLREMQSLKLEPINIGSITLKKLPKESEIKRQKMPKCSRCST
ncbi:hypothetical protein PUN28_000260 [Cardiocondyla obscurior]